MSNPKPKGEVKWWLYAWLIILSPLILAALVLAFVFFLAFTVCLHTAIWSWWCLRGRDILFVYSDSPIWHDYIEQKVLPHIRRRTVILNWSQRKGWRFSLARMAVHHFGGDQEFNPMAVVFRPFRRTRTYRFLQPFRDFKHGHPEALQRMEGDFFGLIGIHNHTTS